MHDADVIIDALNKERDRVVDALSKVMLRGGDTTKLVRRLQVVCEAIAYAKVRQASTDVADTYTRAFTLVGELLRVLVMLSEPERADDK